MKNNFRQRVDQFIQAAKNACLEMKHWRDCQPREEPPVQLAIHAPLSTDDRLTAIEDRLSSLVGQTHSISGKLEQIIKNLRSITHD